MTLSPTTSRFRRATVGAASFLLAACGGSDGPTSTGGDNSGFHMTAKINGSAWATTSPSLVFANQVLPGAYSIVGFQGSTSISISLANIRGPGTYPLGVSPQVPGGSVIVADASGGWATVQSGADGSIAITSLSATEIAGSFAVVASAITGAATGTKTVTEGDFRLGVKQLVPIGAIPDNAGSTVSASIGGAAWNAAFVQGSVTTNPVLGAGSLVQVIASNSKSQFSFILSGVTGPGTYTLGNSGSVTRQMGVTNVVNPQSNSWSSIGAGSSGSVVITSMTATRMKGSFSAVLGPAPGFGTAGTLAVASGLFDVGLP